MKEYPAVTIITLNFNGIKDTRICLKSLSKTDYRNFSVIVADNGSESNEAEILLREFRDKRFSFLRFNKNYGFVGGNNRVVAKVKSPYIVLLNNDTEVTPMWLNELIKVAESDKKIAVCQPKIRSFNDRNSFDYSGAAGGFIDRFGYPFTQGRIFTTLEKDRGQYNSVRDIFWASGAAVLIRRSAIDKVGTLFDEIYFNYMEEIDFCWRVHELGFRIVVVPRSIVFHKVAATAKRNLFRKRFFEHRNNLLLLAKNLKVKKLPEVVAGRFFMEILTYFYYFFSGQFRYMGSLFLAHLDFLIRLSTIERRKSRRYLEDLLFNNSIVIDYYLRGRKTFSELDSASLSGERGLPGISYFSPTFYQHKTVYDFCSELTRGKHVLDLGCGEGYGASIVAQGAKDVTAIDGDKKSIKSARKKYRKSNLFFEVRKFENINQRHKFECLISLQVIEHIQDVQGYLRTVSKLLTKNGTAIFSTPNKITQGYNENPYHIKEYSSDELTSLLTTFFSKVTIYGLHGNGKVELYERRRKENVMKIMNLDKFRLRRLIPRSIKKLVFGRLIPIVRKPLLNDNPGLVFAINEDSYKILRRVEDCLDLIAVCKK